MAGLCVERRKAMAWRHGEDIYRSLRICPVLSQQWKHWKWDMCEGPKHSGVFLECLIVTFHEQSNIPTVGSEITRLSLKSTLRCRFKITACFWPLSCASWTQSTCLAHSSSVICDFQMEAYSDLCCPQFYITHHVQAVLLNWLWNKAEQNGINCSDIFFKLSFISTVVSLVVGGSRTNIVIPRRCHSV